MGAEFLKLRKRRGLVLSALALTVVPMIIAYTVLLILHAADPAKHGPAGGLENFSGSMDVLSQLSVVAAILVGSTLGAGDLGAGVFRELVVTGRSRLALFAARVPAGLGLSSRSSAPPSRSRRPPRPCSRGRPTVPGASLLVSSAAWLGLVTGLALVLALGVSSALGSRGTTIGILLGWQLIAMPLVLADRGTRLAPRRARRRRNRAPRAGEVVRGRRHRADVACCGGRRDRRVDGRAARRRRLADVHARCVIPTDCQRRGKAP